MSESGHHAHFCRLVGGSRRNYRAGRHLLIQFTGQVNPSDARGQDRPYGGIQGAGEATEAIQIRPASISRLAARVRNRSTLGRRSAISMANTPPPL